MRNRKRRLRSTAERWMVQDARLLLYPLMTLGYLQLTVHGSQVCVSMLIATSTKGSTSEIDSKLHT